MILEKCPGHLRGKIRDIDKSDEELTGAHSTSDGSRERQFLSEKLNCHDSGALWYLLCGQSTYNFISALLPVRAGRVPNQAAVAVSGN